MTQEQLAQIAYETYCHYSIKRWHPLTWNLLTQFEQNAWVKAAQAVKANVLSGFTKVGE